MGSLQLAASVVTPLLVYMVVGGIIRKLGIMSVENFKALNTMIFKALIPLALFFDIYRADLSESVRPDVFLYTAVAILLIFGIIWVVMTHFIPDPRDCSTMIQGSFRSNFVLFGGAMAASMCAPSGVALVAALSAMTVPLFNILSVLLFELKRGGEWNLKQLIINIFRNPLVDAGLLGIAASLLHLPIPELIANPLITLGKLASPVALVTLGGILSFGSMRKHLRYLIAVVPARLVMVPLIGVGAAILLGFRGDPIAAMICVFASPTAVASAPMAQAMGGNGELAGEIVATTSVFSIVTIFLFVYTCSLMGWL